MKDLGFNSPYAVAGLCFAVVSVAISTFCDFTVRSAPTNPLGKYEVENVRGARERPEWRPHDLMLEEDDLLYDEKGELYGLSSQKQEVQ